MPALFFGLVLIFLGIGLTVLYLKKSEPGVKPEKNGLNMAVFVLSLFSLLISLKLFYNMGIYADQYGSSPVLVSGGWFWLYMDWVRLGLLFILCLISGLTLIKPTN